MAKPAKKEAKYFDKYWDQNREEINRRRRERYKSDPNYRQKVRDLQRQKYQDTHEPKRGLVTLSGDAEPKDRGTGNRPRIMEIRGRKITVLTIRGLADAMNCSPTWVRALERRGIIPKPTLKSPTKIRLYTEYQVKVITDAVKECLKSDDESWNSASRWEDSILPQKIKTKWDALGKDGVPW